MQWDRIYIRQKSLEKCDAQRDQRKQLRIKTASNTIRKHEYVLDKRSEEDEKLYL